MKFKLEFDTTQARKKLEEAERQIGAKLQALMQEASDILLEETVRRAPIDEGFLQHSVHNKTEHTGTEHKATVFIPANSPASDYAIPLHEDEYNLGEISRQKQASQEEKVGRKYMERAFYDNKKRLLTFLASGIKRTIG